MAHCGLEIALQREAIRLDPQWRCFYEDGTVLDLRDDPQVFAAGRPLAIDVEAVECGRETDHCATACIHWDWSISIRVGP